MTLVDEEARDRIRTDLDTSFLVEAAAGTGKTTELVRRMVAVLRQGKSSLDRMVALTFSDKAAGEMKLRLRAQIEVERQGSSLSKEEKKRLDDALRGLEVARIGTIHSFCADLLRERPLEAKVDPSFSVMDDARGNQLLNLAFDRWFYTSLESPSEGLIRFLRRRDWQGTPGGPKANPARWCAETDRSSRLRPSLAAAYV